MEWDKQDLSAHVADPDFFRIITSLNATPAAQGSVPGPLASLAGDLAVARHPAADNRVAQLLLRALTAGLDNGASGAAMEYALSQLATAHGRHRLFSALCAPFVEAGEPGDFNFAPIIEDIYANRVKPAGMRTLRLVRAAGNDDLLQRRRSAG